MRPPLTLVTVTTSWSFSPLLAIVQLADASTVGARSLSHVEESTWMFACWVTCSLTFLARRSFAIGRASVVMSYLTLLPSTDVTVAIE